jgi:hypothetical protein
MHTGNLCYSKYDYEVTNIERFSSPVQTRSPKVGRPGNPEHTRSVENEGLLVVIRGKTRQGRKERKTLLFPF